ncbi:MAG: GH3 auxin-responsive promoter family protein [Flavobacteriales bacterium]|nr:GH3 auxin-responsive promoter family protein [Flavobacteriales bacterium]
MGVKSFISKYYAAFLIGKLRKAVLHPADAQHQIFQNLIRQAKHTKFGKEHNFESIHTYDDFVKNVPIRDYEQLKSYIDEVVKGYPDILWPGKPIYLCKTSGTTSGAKYIPISKESIPNHIDSAKHALLSYIHETGNASFLDGKMIFLQGSPTLASKNGIPLGRLSGIVAHHVPAYLQKNRVPTFKTNCIDDWEQKVEAIVDETFDQDLRLISGIPAWVQMYFEKLLEKTGKKTVAEVFPNFSLFVYGGVNFEPYRPIFDSLIGKKIDSVETFPASEGFFAFQDSQKEKGLLLVVNHGIFFEFIPVDELSKEKPSRIPLEKVELGVNYALILNTNAGLWGYNIGDTVKFVSKNPYRVVVSGRIKHFTSAFGEHVIAEEVEKSMVEGSSKASCTVREFHVAPQVSPKEGLPYHEWFIEFDKTPIDLEAFAEAVDQKLQSLNPYYFDLRKGNILRRLVISCVAEGAFVAAMKSKGKLGGQNKIPRLTNDRDIASLLAEFKL